MSEVRSLSFPSSIPSIVIAVPAEQMQQVIMIETEARAFATINDQETAEAADALVARAVKLDKAIEAQRVECKKPVLEIARLIDEAAGEARTPLFQIKNTVGRAVVDFNRRENERRAQLRREQEERDRKAAEEQRRLAEEAQRQRDAEEAAARAAREAANEEDPDSLPPAAALASDDDQPPVEAARAADVRPALVVAPVESVTPEERIAARPVRVGSVKVTVRKQAEIVDRAALMAAAIKSGGILNGLQVLTIDEAAVKKAALAGVPFPGVEVTEREIVGAK